MNGIEEPMGKAEILSRIKSAKAATNELPQVDFAGGVADMTHFQAALEANHVVVKQAISAAEVAEIIEKETAGYNVVLSELESLDADKTTDPDSIQAYIVRSGLGVSENGALWISGNQTVRVLPFICEHLIVVVNQQHLSTNMNTAYAAIEDPQGFGVFIAGPSKTADIEQSLVIGAHGAKRMTVILETY